MVRQTLPLIEEFKCLVIFTSYWKKKTGSDSWQQLLSYCTFKFVVLKQELSL